MAHPEPDPASIQLQEMAEQASDLLSAMANPRRLLVLCHLQEGERTVGELVAMVGLSQSALSQHLGKLRTLRLVATRREGQNIYYRVRSGDVRRILAVLRDIYCNPDNEPATGQALPANKAG